MDSQEARFKNRGIVVMWEGKKIGFLLFAGWREKQIWVTRIKDVQSRFLVKG